MGLPQYSYQTWVNTTCLVSYFDVHFEGAHYLVERHFLDDINFLTDLYFDFDYFKDTGNYITSAVLRCNTAETSLSCFAALKVLWSLICLLASQQCFLCCRSSITTEMKYYFIFVDFYFRLHCLTNLVYWLTTGLLLPVTSCLLGYLQCCNFTGNVLRVSMCFATALSLTTGSTWDTITYLATVMHTEATLEDKLSLSFLLGACFATA